MQLLVFDNSLVLLGAPGKIPQEAIPPSTPRKLRFLDPPTLRISGTLRRGVWIFSGTTQWIIIIPLILELT